MKKLLSALLVLSLLTPNSSIKPLNAENSVLVDEASTLEEKALAALEEVKINTDLNTVVSDLYIPTTGLFNSTISWKSSNDDYAEIDDENGKVKIHRPAKGEQAVQVTLTAKLTVKESKEEFVVRLTNPMSYDRLHTLSAEYSVSTELLVNVAVERLLDDIDFVRKLRNGKVSWK